MTSASDELAYLKTLVAQLTDKIKELEVKAASKVPTSKTPAQQLRTILVGPPGAGACLCSSSSVCVCARAPRARMRSFDMRLSSRLADVLAGFCL